MKNLIIPFLSLISCSFVYGQRDTNVIIFNEFNVNVNEIIIPKGNFGKKLGVGVGIYRSIMNQRKINFIFGLEYNLNRQFLNNTYEGHYANATDVQYLIHNLSIPLNVRYNIGKNIKFFVELGIFLDIAINSKRKGIMHTYLPDENNIMVYNKFTFKENAKVTSPNYGVCAGLGIKIPVKRKELIIKADYKFGLRELNARGTDFYIRYFRLSLGLRI